MCCGSINWCTRLLYHNICLTYGCLNKNVLTCWRHFQMHDDVIKWKHVPHYWPFVQGIHWPPVNSPKKGQWRRALMFSMIGAWTNGWVNYPDAGDLRCHRAHYDVTVMEFLWRIWFVTQWSFIDMSLQSFNNNEVTKVFVRQSYYSLFIC